MRKLTINKEGNLNVHCPMAFSGSILEFGWVQCHDGCAWYTESGPYAKCMHEIIGEVVKDERRAQ